MAFRDKAERQFFFAFTYHLFPEFVINDFSSVRFSGGNNTDKDDFECQELSDEY